MIKWILLPVLFLFLISNTFGQIAIGFEVEESAYQFHRKPKGSSFVENARSTGQILGLPSIGPKIWIGDWDDFTISLEGKIDFAFLSFDIKKFKGMGALSFPVLLKFNNSFKESKKGVLKYGIGLGVQWTKSELYALPDEYTDLPNPFFLTIIGEFSIQMVLRGMWSEGESIEFFVRSGFGKDKAMTGSLGAKLNLRWFIYD